MDGYADNRDRSHDSELLIQEGLMAAVVTIVIIPVIVKGLSKMVPWEKYGCEVVGDGRGRPCDGNRDEITER